VRFCNFARPRTRDLAEAGALVGGRVHPLAERLGAAAAGPLGAGTLPRLAEWRDAMDRQPPEGEGLDPAGVILLPPVMPAASFRDFYAFEEHVRAARARRGLEVVPEWYEQPAFYFSNANAFLGHGDELAVPPDGEWLDFELEIGAVLGAGGRDLAPDEAEALIAGYCVLNDWSARKVQRLEMAVGLGPAKGKDFATSLGPVLVTPDEIAGRREGKGYDLAMVARRNGEELTRGNWRSIHWSFGEMIARASRGVELRPGDVFGSGTVGGGCILELGPENAGGWLAPGDAIELEIEGLGVLANRVADD
jgi:fumarylacetoacetate (FAA) hydrolase